LIDRLILHAFDCDRYVEASDDCLAALAIDPSMLRLHGRRGRALLRLGDLYTAEDSFRTMIAAAANPSRKLDEETEESCKLDAVNGLEQIASARLLLTQVSDVKIISDAPVGLARVEELLLICPYMRSAQVHKARLLFLLHRWSDAKAFVEEVTLCIHESLQARYVHRAAQLPSPKLSELVWSELGAGCVRVNESAHVQAMLFMGSDMAKLYVQALKNHDCIRNCCNDVLGNTIKILKELQGRVNSSVNWDWVKEEERVLKSLLDTKALADTHYRHGEFGLSHLKYGDALQVSA